MDTSEQTAVREASEETSSAAADIPSADIRDDETDAPSVVPAASFFGRPRISLQDMVNTSIALKSHLDIEIVDPTPVWPYSLFPHDSTGFPPASTPPKRSPSQDEDTPLHIVEALSGLQREVLLLRNELNFESWLVRENTKQIGRLYEQRIMSRNAEVERQGLVSFAHIGVSIGQEPLTRP